MARKKVNPTVRERRNRVTGEGGEMVEVKGGEVLDPEVEALLGEGWEELAARLVGLKAAVVGQILMQRREMWQATIVACQVDFQVAKMLNDETMKATLRQQTRRALDALGVLRNLAAGVVSGGGIQVEPEVDDDDTGS